MAFASHYTASCSFEAIQFGSETALAKCLTSWSKEAKPWLNPLLPPHLLDLSLGGLDIGLEQLIFGTLLTVMCCWYVAGV